MNISQKHVLVTGASKGIGKAIAIAFAQEGASVAINFRSDTEGAQETLEACNTHSKDNFIVQADVSKEDEAEKMLQEVKENFGSLDILVNNAGIFDENDSPTNVEAFENVFKNNLLSVVLVTKHSLPLMKEGKIINISSIHGKLGQGGPEASAYAASKAALENYTKNLAKDVAPNILVNAIAPGRVETPMWGIENEEERKALGSAHLIKRMIQPEEIADGAVFLAKNDAICGEIVTIDGGMELVRSR